MDKFFSFYLREEWAVEKLVKIANELNISISSLSAQIVKQVLSSIETVEVKDSLAFLHLRYAAPFIVINLKEGRRVERKRKRRAREPRLHQVQGCEGEG